MISKAFSVVRMHLRVVDGGQNPNCIFQGDHKMQSPSTKNNQIDNTNGGSPKDQNTTENPFEGIAAQSQIPATMKLIIEVIKSGDKGFSFHQTKEIQVSFI